MSKFRLPDNLVKLRSKHFDDFGVSRQTLKNWMRKYTTQDGRRLGAKIGGQWYVDINALFDYVEESMRA